MAETAGDKVDLVWLFNNLPWPFPDNSIDLVRADDVITHISRENRGFIRFMDECWRILKFDGQFMISAFYAGSYEFYRDPTNVNPVNECTFAYFDPLEPIAGKELYRIYKPKPWRIVHISFKVNGNMEVLLYKRRIDQTYGK